MSPATAATEPWRTSLFGFVATLAAMAAWAAVATVAVSFMGRS